MTKGYKRLHRFFRRFPGVTEGFKNVTKVYRKLKRGLEGVTEDYKGL